MIYEKVTAEITRNHDGTYRVKIEGLGEDWYLSQSLYPDENTPLEAATTAFMGLHRFAKDLNPPYHTAVDQSPTPIRGGN